MKIFLSHASRDKSLIREIIPELPAWISSWIDEEQLLIGAEIEPNLKSVIQSDTDFVVLFVSRDSLASKWVQRELNWALEREEQIARVFVLPVVLDLDAWNKLKPASFRKRRFIQCSEFSKSGVAKLINDLNSELVSWIGRDLTRERIDDLKAPVNVSLAGRWLSKFSWEPHHESDSGESSDVIEVTQSGARISGETVTGEYQYSFDGRIVGDYLLGEWKSLKLPLFGVYQLKLDIDSLLAITGFWIGNGARAPYHGSWSWSRDESRVTKKNSVPPRRPHKKKSA